ncbi:imelysin family protein [Salipiger sp.]|uniref:imelysin family protein n=1 Tax=Salipiger sp. TaxID=2078585 RepID=UPI003A9820AA
MTRPLIPSLVALCLALPAQAGVQEALDLHILPGLARFDEAATEMAETAAADCAPEAVQPAYQAAFDAWTAVGDIRIGPSETGVLSIEFWPDTRGFTPKTLSRLIADEDPVGRDPVAFADTSIAARGLFALDLMLYDPAYAGYAEGDYSCALVRTITRDLARQAGALDAAWREQYADVLTSAGAEGNATFMTEGEAVRAIYTQILTGLEFTADNRLGRPLGTFDRPRPTRAEAWRSGRSLRNVVLDTEAAVSLARALSDTDLPATDAALERVRAEAAKVEDPALQSVDDPSGRLHVEILQQSVRSVRDAIETEIGVRLGITPGFNSGDGD